MKRPLVAVVAAYASGLLLADGWPAPPSVWGISLIVRLGLILSLVLSLVPAVKKHRKYFIWLLLALLGWTNFAARTAAPAPADLRVLLGSEPAMVTLRGKLAETPRAKIVQRGNLEKWHGVARMHVSEIRREQDFQPATGEVLVSVPELPGADFFAGQPVEISGVIAPPPLPLAEGLFDERTYLAQRGIYFQVQTDGTNDWSLREPHRVRPPLTDRFLAWAHQTLALGLPGEDEPLRLLWAMTLGWRTAFTGDIADPFLQAGTMHMFAIDGLRIALLAGMMVTLLRVLRLARAWCGLVAIPLIWFYTAATGWEASAMRASVMMTMVIGGWALKRPGDLLNSLAGAAFVILVADPRQLLEASFQLSFGVMLVIALLLPPLNELSDNLIARWLAPDPLLAADLVPVWRKKLVGGARKLAHFCGLSFAAWIGSLPLAAKYFHLFSPVSTLANVFAVPLGAGALMANLGALICGHWLAGVTVLFNHAAWFLMVAMTWVSVACARLPGAYGYIPEPSLYSIVLYYVVIIAAFGGWRAGPAAPAKRILLSLPSYIHRKRVVAVLLVLLGVGGFRQWEISRTETGLTVLPLNGGHAVYVDGGGTGRWLINCGNADAVDFTLKEYLHAQGVNRLPRLVLADASARNCGGAARLDGLFDVGELWTSGVTFRSPAYREALADAHHGRPVHRVFDYGATNGCWQRLFPTGTNCVARAGDAALVLRGDFSGTRVLLLADLSRAGQSELLAGAPDLRADVVIAGLPDEGEPLCDALIAAIRPRAIVIADSEWPASRRAGPALRERLARAGVPVFYTRTAGAVKLTCTRAGWRLEPMNGADSKVLNRETSAP